MTFRSKIISCVGLAAVLILARRIALTWGAQESEPTDELEGDSLVADPTLSATRAITIGAPPSDVWPWLVQMGWEHGGFYSYESLENLFGLDIHNAVAICEPWQFLEVGDEVHLAEQVALKVASLAPEQHLVLLGSPPAVALDKVPDFAFSWAFVLKELAPDADGRPQTRLIVRERYQAPSAAARAGVEALQPVSFVMTQRMLRGIRDRAEGTRASVAARS